MRLYARLEETTDQVLRDLAPEALKRRKNMDTVFYRDPECKQFIGRIPWHHTNRPTTRQRVMLNCVWWDVTWMTPRTPYATVRDALVANRYSLDDARRIARLLAKRKGDAVEHLNAYLAGVDA